MKRNARMDNRHKKTTPDKRQTILNPMGHRKNQHPLNPGSQQHIRSQIEQVEGDKVDSIC